MFKYSKVIEVIMQKEVLIAIFVFIGFITGIFVGSKIFGLPLGSIINPTMLIFPTIVSIALGLFGAWLGYKIAKEL
jgi:hypothetical protein